MYNVHSSGIRVQGLKQNGIIATKRESIQKRALQFYKELLDEHSTPNPEVVHYSERAWEKIFSIDKCLTL